MACPPSGSAYFTRPVRILLFNFQGTIAELLSAFWIKSTLDLSVQKAHKAAPSAMYGNA